jgi:hypothetical protein
MRRSRLYGSKTNQSFLISTCGDYYIIIVQDIFNRELLSLKSLSITKNKVKNVLINYLIIIKNSQKKQQSFLILFYSIVKLNHQYLHQYTQNILQHIYFLYKRFMNNITPTHLLYLYHFVLIHCSLYSYYLSVFTVLSTYSYIVFFLFDTIITGLRLKVFGKFLL